MVTEMDERPVSDTPGEQTNDREEPLKNNSAVQGLSLEAHHAKRKADEITNFIHDISQFGEDGKTIKKHDYEIRKNYIESKGLKLELEASENAQIYLDELREKHPEKQVELDALTEVENTKPYQQLEVLNGFKGLPILEVIAEQRTVYHHYDNYARKKGRWVTPEYSINIRDRQERLSLPSQGALSEQYCLLPGARILRGTAASGFGHPGGGEQYFILDMDKLVEP